MDSRAGSVWVRMKARRWVYTFSILATLSLGILIGTVVSYGVKGKEGQKAASDATPLVVPPPQQLSNAFSQIAKQLEPSVVNINTESTIKNVGRRRRGQVPGDEDGGGGMEDFFNRFFGGGPKVLPPPTQANGQDPQNADPQKKKGLFGKIAGIFKDDKSSTPPPKPPDTTQTAPH